MARTPEGALLTDLHRTTQARISTELAAVLAPLWRILDIEDLETTIPAWIAAVTAAVESARSLSIATTSAYLNAFRTIEAGAPLASLPAVAALDVQAVTTSLLVTGPISLKSKIGSGMQLAQAVEQSLAGSTGSAARHALNGGRELTLATMTADPASGSYRRVTSPGACEFCRTIAGHSEGNEAVARGSFQCHDHCHCQPELVYG